MSVVVAHPKHEALSNTPVRAVEDLADKQGRVYHFEETPKMSTYLSAFLVGKFDKVEVLTKRGISVRGYTPVGLSHGALEHTKIAAESIDLYEEYF